MKVVFIGDICTDSYSEKDIERFKKTKLYEFLDSYEGNVIGNLEAPFIKELIKDNKNKYSLINNKSLMGLYDFCDSFNLANNHIYDQGEQGLNETLNNLSSINKKYFGAGKDLSKSREPLIIESDNSKLCILSYSCLSSNSEAYANNSNGGPAPFIYEFVKEDVEKAKKIADYIIVLPHWGKENEFFPTIDQVSIARKIIDLGVDAIIGGHTHTIQAFEVFKSKPIYYSLGNFFFNNFKVKEGDVYYQGKYNKEGMLVELDFSKGEMIKNEYYIKLDENMIPEISDMESLSTPVLKNNEYISDKLSAFNYKKLESNLNLSLKFNGQSMQVVNDSPLIGQSYKPRIESLRVKVKRYMIYLIKKLLR